MPAGCITAGPKSVSAGNGQPLACAAVLQPVPISCHFRGCKSAAVQDCKLHCHKWASFYVLWKHATGCVEQRRWQHSRGRCWTIVSTTQRFVVTIGLLHRGLGWRECWLLRTEAIFGLLLRLLFGVGFVYLFVFFALRSVVRDDMYGMVY